jgi:glycosyltransferase involved in cell wall biosynthesis
VIATDVGGNDELVADGETGFLVPPGDPEAIAARLEQYYEDPELMLAHGRGGRLRAIEEFGLHAMTEKYRDLYLDCMRRTARVS